VAGAGAWGAIALASGPKRPDPARTAAGETLHAQFATVLSELEASRQDVVRQVNARALVRAPLGAAAGLGLWVLGLATGDPVELDALAIFMGGGAVGGYVWASYRLSAEYDRSYKERVLPALAESLGGLAYQLTPVLDTDVLRRERLFRDFDTARASDGFSGERRGLPVFMCQLRLSSGSGDNETIAFDGLILQLDLPRRLSGTTAVLHDAGRFGNLRDRWALNERQRVRLEDPVFEQRYEVYGTDQVEARALLNPAFMERLLALSGSSTFGVPQVLAQDSRLTLALPKTSAGDLFKPPGFQKPAACRETLGRLHADLASLLAAADAAIHLDSPGRPLA
jgi:hypothetical protein